MAAQAVLFSPEEPGAKARDAAAPLRLTAAQLENLKLESVRERSFQPQQTTEGQISLDEDLTTPVFSPYSGRVSQVLAAPGDKVEVGAPLMAVEATEIVQAQDDLAAAVNTRATAKAQLALAEAAARRQRDLYEAKAGALKDLESAEADLVAARGKFQTAETDLQAVRHRLRILGKTEAEIAGLEQHPAAPVSRREAFVRAPIAGTVIQRQLGLGQYIQSNAAAPVFVIGDLSKVWLVANVRESELAAVRLNQQVEVRVPAYPDRTFTARVNFISPTVDPVTHRVAVRAEVENPDGALKPQMFASFAIALDDARPGLAIPESALVHDGNRPHVWIADSDGALVRRDVTIGRRAGGFVEVASGLNAGERVITDGPLFVDRAASGG
jgi:cobalt-zinc-cadmium efflux system membrane fusion protein